jgi:ABC-type nitrate/sulfonate/bicarbonate transport system substrate-binding protein
MLALACACAAALLVAGCGGGGDTTSTPTVAALGGHDMPTHRTKMTLILDYLPNPVHAGIYRAQAAGYYAKNNLDVKIIPPTSTADTLKLIDAGKADVGIADGIDLAEQIDQGRDAQGIVAVAQRPLGGIISKRSAGITGPKQYEGQTVGITGVPSDTAVLDTIVKHAGGDPAKVKKVTIGFNGVQDLENDKVKGFVGFYPSDGVQVQKDSGPTTVFPFDTNGGPAYPGLVAFSTRKRIAAEAPVMRAFVEATLRGYADTIANPQRSLDELLAAVPALKRPLSEAQMKALLPLLKGGPATGGRIGLIGPRAVTALSAFLVANKLIDAPITPARYATDRFIGTPLR